MRLKIAIATVGCRANQADSAEFVRGLDSRAVELVNAFDLADLVVVNTCCVTAEAERDCRKLARRALNAARAPRVVLAGCTVNAVPEFARKIGGGLADRLESRIGADGTPGALAAWINRTAKRTGGEVREAEAAPPIAQRTRALIKVQNGCSHGCAYCIVPIARGPEVSVPIGAVLAEADRLKEAGFSEVVLTGVQLGAWGSDLPGRPGLAKLAVAVADRLAPGRLRLSSIEPWSVGDALIEAVGGHGRICPHLHLPLQSGDDPILAAMGRGYTVGDYLGIVNKIRRAVPDAAIGTDLLFGFPGETSRSFEATMETLRAVAPAYLHAFPFSPRPGTRAAGMSGAPTRETAKKRVRAARAFGEAASASYRAGEFGQVREILVEERRGGRLFGLTERYVPVVLDEGGPSPGALVRARLEPGPENGRLLAIPLGLS